MKHYLTWAPRLLAILFAIFISLFALDALDGANGVGSTIVALLIHLIPTAAILIVVALAWHWPQAGGIGFVAMAVCYLVTATGRVAWSTHLLIAGPLFLIGALFLASWIVVGERSKTVSV